MFVTAWNNGTPSASGSGYGIRIDARDRDRYFKRAWGTVILRFEGSTTTTRVNIDKDSFWSPSCRELIKMEIGIWLRQNGWAKWRENQPPTLRLDPLSDGSFLLRRT
jgi:hypothetical protein